MQRKNLFYILYLLKNKILIFSQVSQDGTSEPVVTKKQKKKKEIC